MFAFDFTSPQWHERLYCARILRLLSISMQSTGDISNGLLLLAALLIAQGYEQGYENSALLGRYERVVMALLAGYGTQCSAFFLCCCCCFSCYCFASAFRPV
jgi:hypothetical protein